MDKWQAQQKFWSSFTFTENGDEKPLPAYDEQTLFEKGSQPAFPHITYQSFGGNLGQTATLSASIWDRSRSWQRVKTLADKIQRKIVNDTPVTIKLDDGYMWIKVPATIPFAQPMASEDDTIKRIVLTVEAECLSQA